MNGRLENGSCRPQKPHVYRLQRLRQLICLPAKSKEVCAWMLYFAFVFCLDETEGGTDLMVYLKFELLRFNLLSIILEFFSQVSAYGQA